VLTPQTSTQIPETARLLGQLSQKYKKPSFAAFMGDVAIRPSLEILADCFLEPSLVTEGVTRSASESGSLEWVLMVVAAVIALSGIALAYYMYVSRPALPKEMAKALSPIYSVLVRKYYVDEAYMAVTVKPLRRLGGFLSSTVDRGLIDGLVNGLAKGTAVVGSAAGSLQAGYVREYAFSILLGVAAILGYLVLR